MTKERRLQYPVRVQTLRTSREQARLKWIAAENEIAPPKRWIFGRNV